jgi:heme/copper-type cytochrome/quinol oxidase subunit 3
MENPANTMTYFIAGQVVIFGILMIYIVSLMIRSRKWHEEERALSELEKEMH